jgi:para-nitrobenzyl esterase
MDLSLPQLQPNRARGKFMRLVRLLIAGSVFFGSAASKAPADELLVHTRNGVVRGVLEDLVESFKALPFAAPPVGHLRWKPPREPAPWSGILDGSKFSPICMQPGFDIVPSPFMKLSEDCLYLNVFRREGAQNLPVMVFIHGGHNAKGSAGWVNAFGTPYDGSDLARNGKVLVVTINYRLGAFGFVAHPALSRESGYGGSGNYGSMDQIQALKWVKRNIAAFGGDPKNVTVVGASMGGGAIAVLMASPLAAGLFHRAIIHSGQFRTQSLKKAEALGVSLSQKLGCRNARNELKCMRGKSPNALVEAMPGGHDDDASLVGPSRFLPAVDHRLLRTSPLKIIRNGKHHHVPILIGNTEDETSDDIYGDESKDIDTEQKYVSKVNAKYGKTASKILELYRPSDYAYPYDYGYPAPRRAYDAISTDRWWVCPAQRLVRALSVSQSKFVGRFLYAHVFSRRSNPIRLHGAAHSYDLPFVFGTFDYWTEMPTDPENVLKGEVQKIWSDFARTGSPGSSWIRYDAKQDNYLTLDTPMTSGSQLHMKHHCDYWDNVSDTGYR